MATTYPGSFITLEGPEGAGKTTQLKLLSRQLDQIGCKHIVTRDPGGTALGKQIRRILLNPENPVMPMTELLLYQADRAQHVDELIRPALEAGTMVLCDRYIHSTIAYQGYARGIDFDLIDKLNQMATGGLMPEITILFDIDSSAGLGRLHPGGHDRLEREALEFHHKVRKGYNELAQRDPEKWAIIDASKPLSVVQEELRGILVDNFSQKHKLAGLLE
jgi:dTMP kinase